MLFLSLIFGTISDEMLGGKYKFLLVGILCCAFPMISNAEVLPLNDALRATYSACVGIDDELADLKKMAGINTAVTGVGTAVNTGATVVGIVKANKDKQVEELEKLLKILSEMENGQDPSTSDQFTRWKQEFTQSYEKATQGKPLTEQINKLNEQSKKLGNWRTGLMAGGTVTNVAGAIIAGNNKVDDDLQA